MCVVNPLMSLGRYFQKEKINLLGFTESCGFPETKTTTFESREAITNELKQSAKPKSQL